MNVSKRMRRFMILLCSACFWAFSLQAQSSGSSVSAATDLTPTSVSKPFEWPVQLELRVPFAPTVFQSSSGSYALYELYLTNFGATDLHLTRIDILSADVTHPDSLAGFGPAQLETMMQPLDGAAQKSSSRLVIAGGQCRIVFVLIARAAGAHWPDRLSHRVTLENSMVQGAEITTHHDSLQTLGAPVQGKGWLAADGPNNEEDNHHRRGVIVLNGSTVDSRRYAIDWKMVKDGSSFAGDPRDVRSYYAYDQPVLAVADGQVLTARDGLPDNTPGHGAAFHPAVPVTLETVAGNNIVLALGRRQFAYYMHLKPGSLLVKAGDRVHKGDVIAHIGSSGDAREPHLHFEVTDSSTLLQGQGLPYEINHFAIIEQDGVPAPRRNQLPVGGSVIDFEK
jgi:hypothetical protein